ncbi:MAG: phosphotransferase [Rhodobacter sp.]|nr:phosphotransferase [Rhodobacter sp.]
MPDRADHKAAFLSQAGWAGAGCRFLADDASARSYDRLTRAGKTAVLMDAPPDTGEDVGPFVAIARHLTGIGLSAPGILAQDRDHGFLLLEDLGDDLFARLIIRDPSCEPALYAAAVDVLICLQAHRPAPDLPDAGAADWAGAAAVALDWYRYAITGDRVDTTLFRQTLQTALEAHANGPRVMILRDYHAENLLWLPKRAGVARVGLLDFQLAQLGQPGYDLVSLCQDARRDVSSSVQAAMIRRFVAAKGLEEAGFAASYATLGAQRALRILGMFARLCLGMGKPGYVALIPRVWAQLQQNLLHPALADLSLLCADLLPDPTASRLERIRSQCAKAAP